MPITSSGGCGCDDTGGCAPVASTGLCLVDGTPIAVIIEGPCPPATIPTVLGWVDLTTGIFTPGSPPLGTAPCSTGPSFDFELSGWLCDVIPDGTIVGVAAVQIERDDTGAIIGITLVGIDGLPYVPVGTMQLCPAAVDDEWEVLCDAGVGNLPFLRRLRTNPNLSTTVTDFELDGITPYFTDGPVVICGCANTTIVLELCDKHPDPDAGDGLIVPFLRTFEYDCAGVVLSLVDTELDGVTPYVPNSVVLCSPVTGADGGPVLVRVTNRQDDELEILCDDGTQFLRRYSVDASGVVVTTDTTLNGVTPYVVVGVVAVCPSEVIADTGALVRSGHQLLSGVGTWALGVDTGGGKVKSISFRRRAGGAAAAVTIADDFGNTDEIHAGESETWSVTGLEDQLTGTLSITSTNAATRIIIDWTEV